MDSAPSQWKVIDAITGFNGATSFQKWIDESELFVILIEKYRPFQWSHFFSEMDSSKKIADSLGVPIVSMEPLLFRNG